MFDHIRLVYDESIFSYAHADNKIIKSSVKRNQEVNISKEDDEPGCSSNNLKKIKTSEKDFDSFSNYRNKPVHNYDIESDSDSDSEIENKNVDQEKPRCFKNIEIKKDERKLTIYKRKSKYEAPSTFQSHPEEFKKYNVEPAEHIEVDDQQDGIVLNSYTLPCKKTLQKS